MRRMTLALLAACAVLNILSYAQTKSGNGQEQARHFLVPVAPPTVPVRVSAAVAERLIVTRVASSYPKQALAACVEGRVIVDVVIDGIGKVERAEFRSGPALLAQAAVEAVRQWRYKPFLMGGHGVRVRTTATVRFQLPKSECGQI